MTTNISSVKFSSGYQAAKKLTPEKAFRELEQIKSSHRGELHAADVVAAAKPKRHLLHSVFQWDDPLAANEYRNEQARRLIRSIRVVYKDAPGVETHAYNVTTVLPDISTDGSVKKRAYRSTADLLADPEARSELLNRALQDLLAFQRRFRGLQELAPVFRGIEQMFSAVETAEETQPA